MFGGVFVSLFVCFFCSYVLMQNMHTCFSLRCLFNCCWLRSDGQAGIVRHAILFRIQFYFHVWLLSVSVCRNSSVSFLIRLFLGFVLLVYEILFIHSA